MLGKQWKIMSAMNSAYDKEIVLKVCRKKEILNITENSAGV